MVGRPPGRWVPLWAPSNSKGVDARLVRWLDAGTPPARRRGALPRVGAIGQERGDDVANRWSRSRTCRASSFVNAMISWRATMGSMLLMRPEPWCSNFARHCLRYRLSG